MKLDYKGGKITWNLYDAIDWSKKVTHATEGFLSEDILTLEYDNCLIDLGWYGSTNGHFTIKVIVPTFHDEDSGKYSSEDWMYPYANIPCENQYDMFLQLQRAIDIYPQMTNENITSSSN
jgi:hypothetical protein